MIKIRIELEFEIEIEWIWMWMWIRSRISRRRPTRARTRPIASSSAIGIAARSFAREVPSSIPGLGEKFFSDFSSSVENLTRNLEPSRRLGGFPGLQAADGAVTVNVRHERAAFRGQHFVAVRPIDRCGRNLP